MKTSKLALIACGVLAVLGAQAQDIQDRTIKVGHLVQADHPISVGVKKYAEIVASRSGGKLKIKEFGSSVLGSDAQQISALQGGIQEMVLPSTTVVGPLIKEFSLIDMPFTITTPGQADAMLQGAFGQELLKKLPEKGLIGLDYWETGFRNFTNSRKPINELADLKGLKIRVLGNPLFVESFAALGTNPVPMAFGEVYGALESRAIDAQENPYNVISSSKFYEVQKFLSVTNHVYTSNILLVSKKFWDKLSPTEQKILTEAAREAGAYERKFNRDASEKTRKEIEAKGMKINEVPLQAIASMRQAVQPVSDKFMATFDPAIVSLYKAELQKASSAK
ncbi:TRAP transporter substrate-binding protein [Variovorax boronicumulans]|uniref:TRAP transporter substrate-binding protein n=2 Tax=Variovorax boronicumulans TaxID=436515 RepID=UPI002780297B|nr:TRAP transporter substrate-binding protein [Variovorax boronicumulans]MDQ0044337.1 tripartite ATP-independent transporter DctP family solute receptor [Variovorax boronicumulans]